MSRPTTTTFFAMTRTSEAVFRSLRLPRLPWLAMAYVATRLVAALSSEPNVFPDSAGYRWTGLASTSRPYGISIMFGTLTNPAPIVIVQTMVASLLWCWLFSEIRKFLDGSPRTGAAAITVCALMSLSKPIVMWDRNVLSETLAIAMIAALAAAWLRIKRLRLVDGGSTGSSSGRNALLIGVVVLVVMALVRETVFLAIGLPVAATIAACRSQRLRRLAVFAALAVVLIPVALKPTRVVLNPNGVTLGNLRVMNIIGVRILPDPYLRRRMEAAGMPPTSAEQQLPRSADGEDFYLYKIPGMLAFADDFPNMRFFSAQMSRPTNLVRRVLPGLDHSVGDTTITAAYGLHGDELVPPRLSELFWTWSSPLHLAMLALLFGLRSKLRAYMNNEEERFNRSATWLVVLCSVGALAAVYFDAIEIQRHPLPMYSASRVAMIVALVTLVGPATRWSRSSRRLVG